MGSAPVPTGDELLKILGALGNPHRMRIIQALTGGRNYVSRLARDLGISRPLLHMHLQRLEAAGLVVGSLELSEDGKAMKFFEVAPFVYRLTPEAVAAAAASLTEAGAAAEPAPEATPRSRRRRTPEPDPPAAAGPEATPPDSVRPDAGQPDDADRPDSVDAARARRSANP
ncbi:winged helix-turn-helix domain-containing protein [Streptomyces sp. 71268]|uniref:ArsR/SmtB family transcription factor n=1 Tax=Streptomyces sp. 71268 TaxID=3002640 RepID=UPI0023F89106|nr:winged helix-turn-helix domain-containing protein [Streptomyces sp. 71268]WEV26974.1 winged helix-turn-helix domain-containing protein [Streptomyces sp. 71268]